MASADYGDKPSLVHALSGMGSASDGDDGPPDDDSSKSMGDPGVQAMKLLGQALDDEDYEAAYDAFCSLFRMQFDQAEAEQGETPTSGPPHKPSLAIVIGHGPSK